MLQGIIRHGTQLAVAVLIICVLGIVAAFRVPVQMIPDLEVRTITVVTQWPGATPQDVEKEILIEQEDYLRTIPNLHRMIASAETGEAVIELEFPFGVDINDALIRVNNALSQVPDYPENTEEPRLYATSFSQNAFMYFRIEPLASAPPGLDMDMMRDFVDDNVRTRMERVPGVSQVSIRSGAPRQIQIEVDPVRLAATNVSLTEVRDAVRTRNRDVSAGDIDSGKRRYLLRTAGRFEEIDDLEDLIIDRRGDAIVRLRDVAEVRLDHAEISAHTYVNGKPAIFLSVQRETGSNVILIREAMMKVVADINSEVLQPRGMQMELTSDDVRYVKASIVNVWKNLAIGAVLATTVMFLFLRSLPATLVGVVGIPICTIAAFIGLLAAGRTINVISLAGIAFAIGMTLDNSIVVLESIERERRRGLKALDAAIAGMGRVWTAVLASTLTTVLVFAPVLFIQEEAGQLFSDIAIAISASIIASMLVAVTVIPAASARVSMGSDNDDRGLDQSGGFRGGVLKGVGWLVATPLRQVAAVGGILAATALIIIGLTPKAEYLPEGEEAKTFSVMIPPPGYNLTEMNAIADELHADLLPYIGNDPALFAEGKSDVPAIDWLLMFVSPQRIFIVSETVDPRQIDSLMEALDARFTEVPGMRAFSSRGSIISGNDGGTRSVNLDIAGPDLREIYDVALAAYRRAETVFGNPQINSEPSSLTLAQPLIEIRPDWKRAAELGFTAAELGFAVSALTDGAYVDEFLLDGDRVDIFLYSSHGLAQTLGNLNDLPLYTPQGSVVPLSAVADLVEQVDTDSIRRVDGERTVTLQIIAPPSVPLESSVAMVQQDVVGYLRDAGEIPPAVSLDISGASDELEATRSALLGNFMVALILSYLLLVAIFTHWGYPLIIMTTVPLGIAGGIVGLWLLNLVGAQLPAFGLSAIQQPFDMITMLGFLILLGTVVNNPILIVDQTMRNVREGLDPRRAVQDAVSLRLRPMMMSMTTTVFGIAPLVFIPGAGTELYRGVGAIVLFGLLFATLVTIVFLPPLLVLLLETLARIRRRAPRRSPAQAEPAE